LVPRETLDHLTLASSHLHAQRLVVIPTETVYGLGANTLSPLACRRVYQLKGRPSDNPLIVHIDGLDMLTRLIPEGYIIPEIYNRLVDAFWPGPLTLLFPHRSPPPAPAPQTIAIRLPAHPLARALIGLSGVPISAPSANSSGRPSPTEAIHVWRDLGVRGAIPDRDDVEEQGVLGCILDAGPCEVGLESTVVDGTAWARERGGGEIKVLRPGGVGVEDLERVVMALDGDLGTKTRVWVYGRDRPEEAKEVEVTVGTKAATHIQSPERTRRTLDARVNGEIANPSTPGMKYKHYSPSVPVFLLYPSDTFVMGRMTTTATGMGQSDHVDSQDVGSRMGLFINKKPVEGDGMGVNRRAEGSKGEDVSEVLRGIVSGVVEARGAGRKGRVRLGVMAFENSSLRAKIQAVSTAETEWDVEWISLGQTVDDAARRLFAGMLQLEGRHSQKNVGVDAILIEATGDGGLGLAFMERAGKAVGGGGGKAGLGSGASEAGQMAKRFLVDVEPGR
jgi:L-threonylcarbamoyladenylate synthase